MIGEKSQGLSLNTMVIAAIVLIVLAVVILIFNNGISIFPGFIGNQTECENRQGTCVDEVETCREDGGTHYSSLKCKDPEGTKKYCCVKEKE